MSAHTFGQWMSVDGNFIYALDDDGQVNRFHAQVCAGYAGGARTPKGEIEAITRLMLAAPELLSALRDLANDIAERFDLESPSTNPGIKHTVEAARAAIFRATGAA